MYDKLNKRLSSVLYLPHGGGPLPLFGDKGHQKMIGFLKNIAPKLGEPSAIVVISAHWEENQATITSNQSPSLLYDYYGFPDEAYQIEYPVPGDPILAKRLYDLLLNSGIEAKLDEQRGFDHGVFVPLKIMFPDASIPCVQLSLLNNMDPESHINLGKALSDLRKDNVLIIGSGLSFHNMGAFMSQSNLYSDPGNEAFEKWLIDTCTNESIPQHDREIGLIEWEKAPFARYCHPREDHLLPLHVCFGASNSAAKLVFDDDVLGKKTCAFLW